MWGWVGQLASAFASGGLAGLVLLALLVIIACLLRLVSQSSQHLMRMHREALGALDRSTDAHKGVSRVLGRIEGILGISEDG